MAGPGDVFGQMEKPCQSLNFVLPEEVKDALVGFIALYSCICLISGWLLINIRINAELFSLQSKLGVITKKAGEVGVHV